MSLPQARPHELTAVGSRSVFDDPPWTVETDDELERWRDFRRRYHEAQALHFVGDFPLQIDLELTSLCQLRCSFCTHGHERVARVELDRLAVRRVLDEGSEHGLVSIKLNYINEPLLSDDLEDVIEYARLRGVLNTYFATNGLALTEERSRSLIEAGVSKIMVSLDATTSKTFEAMRQSRSFDRIVENVRTFLRVREEETPGSGPKLRVNFLRTRLNVHEVDDFLETWEGVADAIGYQTQVALPGVDENTLVSNVDDFRCSFPFKLLVVDANGSILPCCTFNGREMPLGNVGSMGLAEAWRTAAMLELRAVHKRGGYGENPICAHCITGCATPG